MAGKPTRLFLLSSTGHFQDIEFLFSYTVSNSLHNFPDDASWVANVDGRKILLTPYQKLSIPPPMSLLQVELPA